MPAPWLRRSAFALMSFLVLIPWALGQQNNQNTGNTGSASSTTGTTVKGRTARANAENNSNTRIRPEAALQNPQMPFISGLVMMEDGSAPPLGVVIEQVCGGRSTKVARPAADGSFGYQMGNSGTILDASMSGTESRLGSAALGQSTASRRFSGAIRVVYMDCNLRAQLGGYRSTSIHLNLDKGRAVVDAGTLVLVPKARARGTTVSVADLQAPKKAVKSLDRAEKAFQQNKLQEAQKHLKTALEAYPQYATAWYRLGLVYRETGRLADARRAQEKALESDGNYVIPYLEIAQLAAMENNWEEAVEFTEIALSLNPIDYPWGYYLNSVANYNLGRINAAEEAALKAGRIDLRHLVPEVHLILAAIYQQVQDSKAEAEQLQYYLQYAPDAPGAKKIQLRLQALRRSNGS
jgi:hypothetical protein